MSAPRTRRLEPGLYETRDGRYRIVNIGPDGWQVQETTALGWWSWVTTVPTKRAALASLEGAAS